MNAALHTLLSISEKLDFLQGKQLLHELKNLRRGIEKESLRIQRDGQLAQTPHPATLGSALTHPYITTDFSEALLEFITPVSTSIDDSLEFLEHIHRYVYSQLRDELLWITSMPCILGVDDEIPVAQFGSSNIGKMKEVYRIGLGYRYGRVMQTIAGIHYNFSIPDEIWIALQQRENNQESFQDYKTRGYFSLIRNFRRFSWLLIYLFGASPVVCKSFLSGRQHPLEEFDEDSLYLPYATSLRMGNLGYQSTAQDSLKVSYNDLESYSDLLNRAMNQPYPPYSEIGVQHEGEYRQLNDALLQIENEFYSSVRPKRVTQSGEKPLHALRQRGVEYVELRCIDINPFTPLGIDAEQIRFIDTFLLYCLLADSPLSCDKELSCIQENQTRVVNRGRDPELKLKTLDGEQPLAVVAQPLIQSMAPIAEILDSLHQTDLYRQSLDNQADKVADSEKTPSAQILKIMRENQQSFSQFGREYSEQIMATMAQRPLDDSCRQHFDQLSQQSLLDQKQLEKNCEGDFEQYLKEYFAQPI
ncbi:MAG: glutamate--cysteine ligase [Pseudomonadales bacterium]|nr:glutamate--cysteine ligase [Pseudomonadales bacterium]